MCPGQHGGLRFLSESEGPPVADNLTLQSSTLASPPSATVFATDDVSGVHYPLSKLGYGALDSFTIVSTSAGLPVAQQGTWNVGTVTTVTTVTTVATVTSITNAVTITDGGNVISVDDGGSTLSIDDGGGSITIDGTVAVSGTVTVSGTVAATQSGSWSVSISGTPTVDTELPAAAALADNTANPTVPGVGAYMMVFDGTTWDRFTGSMSMSGAVDTELPAAAALGDNTANPTAPAVGSFPHWWDGATWDRAPGTAADGALVNLGSNNDVTVTGTVTANAGSGTFVVGDGGGSLTVDNAGTFAVQVDGAALTALQLIDDAIVADDAAFTPATTKVMMAGFEFDDTTPDTVNEGDAGAARMSSRREVYVQLRDAAGNERGLNVDASGNIGVTDAGSTLSIDDGAGSITVDNGGTFAVQAAQSGTWNIGTVTTVTTVSTVTAVTTITNAVTVVGNAAEDAALSGNPVRLGVRASRAIPTSMSADGDVVTPWADREGRQVTKQQCGTGTQTSVGDSATSVSLLAANTQRLGAIIVNDSAATLYVKLGATASTTSYAYKLYPDDTVEIPAGYTGAIDGIWSSDAGGNARITELT